MSNNDTSTLNGALAELGETLATNLNNKGVTASASDGLTTLANKINQIYTGECYFIDSLDINDYILRNTSVSTINVEENAIKIANSTTSNQSVFVSLNRGPIVGNWKATYEIKTNNSISLISQIGTGRTTNSGQNTGTVNTQTFKKVEWTVKDGSMNTFIDGNQLGTTLTYTPSMFYPIIAFYFNRNKYALIKNLKIIKI